MCSQLEPLPDTPQSPPAYQRGQNFNHWTDTREEEQFQYQPANQHIRGVAVGTSEICGTSNQIYQRDCAVTGGISFDIIKEEVTFDYLERERGPTWQTKPRNLFRTSQ